MRRLQVGPVVASMTDRVTVPQSSTAEAAGFSVEAVELSDPHSMMTSLGVDVSAGAVKSAVK